MEYDVVVVGGGAAGLTAAMVLARARRRVAVVDAGEPRNAPAAHMHGYLFQDGMPPAELLAVGRAEVAGYGGEVIAGRVLGIDPGFVVRLRDGRELAARTVLVATGLWDELPEVPGLRERWGRDVLHCPYCHGYEVRDAPIGVLGGQAGEMFLHQVELLRQWSADLVFFPNQVALTADEAERLAARGIRVVEGEVARFVVSEDRLAGVELADGQVEPRAAMFVPPRMVPQDELLTGLGCRVENGWVAVDANGQTSVRGVWAAGNVVNPKAQVIMAAGAGSAAAAAINVHLLEGDIERELSAFRTSAPRGSAVSTAAPGLSPA